MSGLTYPPCSMGVCRLIHARDMPVALHTDCNLSICRDIEGMSPIPGDKWATREFHIKWRRWSFIHTSWDNLATLSQLAGYKRVTNYMKRADEAEVCLCHYYTC
jgi:hypothetical protein